MKALITNYRYWVLTALAFIIIIGLVAIPQDGTDSLVYYAMLFGTKLVALIALFIYVILYLHWEDEGKIPELTSIINEEE